MARPVDHAVELALDQRATNAVLACMASLEDAGIASLRRSAPYAHPHVSLTVATSGRPEDLAHALEGLGADLAGTVGALSLSHVGMFLAPARVVFLGVTMHDGLAGLHARVLERLAAARIATRALYDRGRFVPHCTLAMHVASLGAAVEALKGIELPIECAPSALGVVEVPTGRLLATVA